MIGRRYWSSGITVRYSEPDAEPAWMGSLDFQDEGLANDIPAAGLVSTRGRLETRYFVPAIGGHRVALASVTDTLKRDAEGLGIEFRDPWVYADADGEDPSRPMPGGWRRLLREEADRLGWGSYGDELAGEEVEP